MAAVAPTYPEGYKPVFPVSPGNARVVAWTPLTATDNVGTPVQLGAFTDRSVQVVGTFDGSTITIQGSNDGSNWATLTDGAGNNLTFTAAGLKSINEAVSYLRPSLSGGTAPSLSVYVFAVAGSGG